MEKAIIDAILIGLRERFSSYSDAEIRWSYTDSKVDIYLNDEELPTHTLLINYKPQ